MSRVKGASGSPSSTEGAAAGAANLYDDEQVDLTDQDSQSTVESKRKGGRPEGDDWDTFTKKPNPFPGKSKRNWIGVCKFCQHLLHFKESKACEAILKKEEDLQRIEELANAEAVAEAAAHDIEKDACDTRAAPSMELCSTEEMMSVFGEFYEGDKKDMHVHMARSHINSTCIEASVDVTAEEFDLEFAGSVAEVSMPDLDYGNDDGGWDVANLLQVA
ncbi:TPA: hypothetical protein ACH3X1_015972 [Trebouxia sp. C0004]